MTRWKATSLHLILSLSITATVGLGLVSIWYGRELFEVMGGQRLLLIMAITNIVIGPLLTMIVYKPGKPSLKLDMTIIFVLQLAFLGYGLKVMADSRPVFLVGVVDRYELVFANELDLADLAKGSEPRFRELSWRGPVLVGGRHGETSKEQLDLALSGLGGKDIHLLPERYADIVAVTPALAQKMAPARALAESSPAASKALQAFAEDHGRELSQLFTLPLTSRRGRATMVVDSDAIPVGPIDLDPWIDLSK